MRKIIILLLFAALIIADVVILMPELGVSVSDCLSGITPESCRSGSVSYLVVPSDDRSAGNDGRPVVVLDPGHGGSDPGAVNKALGMEEAEINLRISRALADKLSASGKVKVYLTRETLGAKEKKTLEQRVNDAVAVKADVFLCMHNNYAAKNSSGAEIYISGRDNDASYGAYLLASQIMGGFGDIGMRPRGIYRRMSESANTDAEGKLYDYYGVIRMCGDHEIPAMLIEHGFLNELDKDFIASPEAAGRIAESEYHAIMRWFGFEPEAERERGSGDGDGSGILDDADIMLAGDAILCANDSPEGETFRRLDTDGSGIIDTADASYICMLKNGIACIPVKKGAVTGHKVSADREDFRTGEKIRVTVELSGAGSLISAYGTLDYDEKSFAFEKAENASDGLVVVKDEEYGLIRWYLPPSDEKASAQAQPETDAVRAELVFKMTKPREDGGYSINSAVQCATFYDCSSCGLMTYDGDIQSVIMGKSGQDNAET